jgi:putative pyruvate formate lyase activating enzyme
MEVAQQIRMRTKSLHRRLTAQEITQRRVQISQVLSELRDRLDPCTLCPRKCAVQRSAGELGECGLGRGLRVASVALHKGEEPPVSGRLGAINLFFSGCNLHCLHCQNWPISQQGVGQNMTPQELAGRILKKWRRGIQALGWVTPTPQIVGALEAYQICLDAGCDLPLVHNGGGYEDPGIVNLLAGIVDMWLPDAKTGDPDRATHIQSVRNYPERNLAALTAMVAQSDSGQARAVIVRHLILPGGQQDSRKVLSRLWENFGDRIHLSLMAQYFPTYRTQNHESLGRRVTVQDYNEIVAFARDLGFHKGWVQQLVADEGISPSCL